MRVTAVARCAAIAVALVTSSLRGQQGNQRIYHLADLTSNSIAALDPTRTILILAVDPIEEHGPHLPVDTDVIETVGEAEVMAARLTDSLSDWRVVLMPTVSYGVGGANLIPDRRDIPGTFSLRATTLRAILVDLGSQVADHGFRWLFVVNEHGGQTQAAAINDAADFVRETRGITMLNLGAIAWYLPEPHVDAFRNSLFTEKDRARIGFDIHAGVRETSRLLALRSDLVDARFRALPDLTVHGFDDLVRTGQNASFQGYWSAPALADSAYGKTLVNERADQWTALALRSVRGEQLTSLRRYPDGEQPDANRRSALRSLARERELTAQVDRWLARRKSIIR
jgi:creatinine amidohydrolase